MRHLSVVCYILLFCCACGHPSSEEEKKSNMRLSLYFNPATIDTRKNSDVCSSSLIFMIYEGLTRLQPDGSTELALAKAVEISEDQRLYRFHLRNALWSDGIPITAHDFEYSWKKVLTPEFGSPCPYLFYCIENAEEASHSLVSSEEVSIKALDDKTLEVRLKNPTPYFLSLISFCNFFPIPKHIEEKNPLWFLAPGRGTVSNGPFKLDAWNPNKEIKVVKNPLYWDVDHVSLNSIQINIIRDQNTSLSMFENGDVDFLSSVTTPMPIDDLALLKKNGRVETRPLGGTLFCTFNLKHPLLTNFSIRKALCMAIDRKSLIDNISQLDETLADRYIPPLLCNTHTPLFPHFNPQEAKFHFLRGLEELGWELDELDTHLGSLVFRCESLELPRRIAQVIQEQWKTILGIDVELKEGDFKNHVSDMEKKEYAMALHQWIIQYPDPVCILERFKYADGKKNFPGYENPGYIQLLDTAAICLDSTYRRGLLNQAEELMASAIPLFPLFHYNQAILKNSRFSDISFTFLGNLIYKKVRPSELDEEPL